MAIRYSREVPAMMALRIVAAGVALAVVLPLVSFGQDAEKPKLKGFLPFGWKQLGLSDAQKQAVYAKQAEYTTRLEKLEEQIKALRAERDQELVKLLTDAQRARLRELAEEKLKKLGGKTDPKKDE
jgi:negative regulator of sigma E activity